MGEMSCPGRADSMCRSIGRQNLDNLALSGRKPKSGEVSQRSMVHGHGAVVKEGGPYPGAIDEEPLMSLKNGSMRSEVV